MESIFTLEEKVELMKDYDVCIIGLGYVGLTLAAVLAKNGLRVLGVEKRQDIVDLTNSGLPHFHEVGLKELLPKIVTSRRLVAVKKLPIGLKCKTIFITVGTPLDEKGVANLQYIRAAAYEATRIMVDGSLVILRSTVKVGTTRKVVEPILAETGFKFSLAMCPERTLEGKALEELRVLPQIIGADNYSCRREAVHFFNNLTPAIIQLDSYEAAEVTKLIDNTYRDVQFAFANEVARIADVFGLNADQIIQAGKFGYPRTNVAMPGPVGGPCLEKDPHILRESCKEYGVELPITSAARQTNESQPSEITNFIFKQLEGIKNPKIAVLGLAFKGVPETNDLRGSMSLRIISCLKRSNSSVHINAYDPACAENEIERVLPGIEISKNFFECITDCDVVIIANNHPEFKSYTPRVYEGYLRDGGFIFDCWNHFSSDRTPNSKINYFAIGNLIGDKK